jgi:hypothetical protein
MMIIYNEMMMENIDNKGLKSKINTVCGIRTDQTVQGCGIRSDQPGIKESNVINTQIVRDVIETTPMYDEGDSQNRNKDCHYLFVVFSSKEKKV